MARQKDFWDKLPTAKGSKGGVYFEPDHHFYVTIGEVIDNDGRDDDQFIIEAQVIESTSEKQGEGFCASQVIALSYDAAAGNVGNFLRAAYTAFSRQGPEVSGFDEPLDPTDDEDWTELKEMYAVAAGEDQVLSGLKIYLKTKGIITKKNKVNFTIHDWSADKPDTWPKSESEAA